ncbi:MAG: hypothetical protein IJA10_00660 [Lachnospiraceae bacterium]|nr:hypothetical protein [Lachnospiraceae bacterium]
MYKYRITKYNPQYRDDKDIFMKNEWTSYTDIGKIYNEHIFLKEEYLSIEEKYCAVYLDILKSNGVSEVAIKDLECYFSISEINQLFKQRGLELSMEDEKIMCSLANDKKIKVNDLQEYIKLILRECFWCRFEDEVSSIQIEFGYDYYSYIFCNCINESLINKYKKMEIFIEKVTF